ncbi:MAG: hypothetical protein HY819_10370 [Acidobacteria bacterium]|nr:hypothetical protein [Acidobacteriota bacterium]
MLHLKKAVFAMVCLLMLTSLTFAQDLAQDKKNDKEPKQIGKIIRLKPTSISPEATAIVRVSFSNKKEGDPIQNFEIITVNVNNKDNYRLFVDGVEITSREAKAGKNDLEASFVIEFSSKAKDGGKKGGAAQGLPASLDPVTKIRHIEIRDTNNQVILTGDFAE